MKVTAIAGIDVSKNSLDVHLFEQQQSKKVSNDLKGFSELNKWLKKHLKSTQGLMTVMEYTGIYTYGLEKYLDQKGICFVKRPALDIKRSVGMVRGKSDKADAAFISKYGWMRKEELTPMKPLNGDQLDLQQLMSLRDKLVTDAAAYKCKLKELVSQMGKHLNQAVKEPLEAMIKVLEYQRKEVEMTIKKIIAANQPLQTNYDLACSVSGIGFVTAVHLLIATENFTKFSDARKLICYCGVAPFEHSSGTSIRGKTRVSHLANKKLKALLTVAAISAKKYDPELKAKYEQKIIEGKAKMSVLNIIRAKIIERVFTVIKRQTPYVRVAA